MKKSKQAELISQMSDAEVQKSLYVTQFALLTISCLFGIFLFKDLSSFFAIFHASAYHLLLYGVGGGLAVVLVDLIFMRWLPAKYYDDGGINERLFANQSVAKIAAMAFIVAVSEEIFFRGILQTAFGLAAASLIFALIHVRYLSQWFLAINVILLSFWIGLIYEWTSSVTVTIVVHFIIDFLLGLVIRHKARQKALFNQEGIDDDHGPLS
ncbi:membrane protease YdiL (CAAX protease family) [Bacillus ectoiniformans]|uniref:CPBP family intramembrane glutamic endopeptidase n=1 Tax=Bacillus ectoiniformans TaxID=1494429 RepID=UPI00195C8EBC|nr:type II CAAX endopeptidase family protein [Bacillus ectoiniformans]MBM7648022.1 membrane protease YdiL (CAAX protease family) [Bacillus ectoiniformans]